MGIIVPFTFAVYASPIVLPFVPSWYVILGPIVNFFLMGKNFDLRSLEWYNWVLGIFGAIAFLPSMLTVPLGLLSLIPATLLSPISYLVLICIYIYNALAPK